MDALKFGASSIIYGMIRTLSKNTYDFIKSGIIWKSSSNNFMLDYSKRHINIIVRVVHHVTTVASGFDLS